MYYLGFLKHNYKDVIVFQSLKKPVSKDYTYFVRVMGPFATEMEARTALRTLERVQGYQGYKENPSRVTLKESKENIKRAIALTRKVMKLYGKIRKVRDCDHQRCRHSGESDRQPRHRLDRGDRLRSRHADAARRQGGVRRQARRPQSSHGGGGGGGCGRHRLMKEREHAMRRMPGPRRGKVMDRETIGAYDAGAAGFANDWHAQPAPTDLHDLVRRYFRPGRTADVGCGSGREVAFLAANGFDAVGYDASDALLEHARLRYPKLQFRTGVLPALEGVPDAVFDNVLCETVIMHLRRPQILAAVRRLIAILKPGGTLYLSWRVTKGADQRDPHGRLYSVFESALVREALDGIAMILLDDEPVSASSGKCIHRIVARRNEH